MEREGCPEVAEETEMKVYAIRSDLVEIGERARTEVLVEMAKVFE